MGYVHTYFTKHWAFFLDLERTSSDIIFADNMDDVKLRKGEEGLYETYSIYKVRSNYYSILHYIGNGKRLRTEQ